MSRRPPKAFDNSSFMNSSTARPLRIMAEYMDPLDRLKMHKIQDMIVFFGSARIPSPEEAHSLQGRLANTTDPAEIQALRQKLSLQHAYEDAQKLAYSLAQWSKTYSSDEMGTRFAIVTGGGPGIMEAANRGAKDAGTPSIGMSIAIPGEHEPNAYIDPELSFQFHYFFMRKFWLTYLSKAVVVCPGGFGTIDEFSEILTLLQNQKIDRPCPILLLNKKYWTQVINFNAMIDHGVISEKTLSYLHMTDDIDEGFTWLTQQLASWAVLNPGAGVDEPSLSLL
ncbi:MAG: LOG family protein [Alphaproteobacteria bacterium]|nr:LOG family protein [Alphaproteobacteria bacterium]